MTPRRNPHHGGYQSHSPVSLLLLVGLFFAISPHLLRLPVPLSLFILVVLGYRALHDFGHVRLPGRLTRYLLMTLAIFLIFIEFNTLIGREAGTALFLSLISLKLFEMSKPRDVFVVLYLCYFAVILAFLFSQSMLMLIYTLLTTLALLLTQIYQSQTIASPQLAWHQFRDHLRLASRLILYALPLTLVLFYLFPRIPGPLWGLPEDAFNARTGLSDQMSPGRISRLSNNNAVAFRARFTGTVPDKSEIYWRGPVMWHFDGRTWTGDTTPQRVLLNQTLPITALSEPIDYTVTLEPHQQRWLFTVDMPLKIPPGSQMSLEREVLARHPLRELFQYQATSVLHYQVDVATRWNRSLRYLELPANVAPQTRQLMSRLRNRHADDAELLKAVLDYFRDEDFYYSRKAPLLFDDPVDEFLFDTRKGYCEHYASSFTVMMRLAGIPARVVTGYLGGEMNPLSDYMIVRQSDAHAWSEVWLQSSGWVRVDPTSVIPAERIENTEDILRHQPETTAAQRLIIDQSWLTRSLQKAGYALDAVNNRWQQWVVGFNEKKQKSMFSAFGIEEVQWPQLSLLLGICIGGLLMLFTWRVLRHPRPKPEPVLQAYQKFCRRLSAIGFEKYREETPQKFARRVVQRRPDIAGQVRAITQLYQQLHYAGVPSRRLQQDFIEQVNRFRPDAREP